MKADGLAAGKGVIIPKDNEEAKLAARSILEVRSIFARSSTQSYLGRIRESRPYYNP